MLLCEVSKNRLSRCNCAFALNRTDVRYAHCIVLPGFGNTCNYGFYVLVQSQFLSENADGGFLIRLIFLVRSRSFT